MKRIMAVVAAIIIMTITIAAPAQADASDRNFVKSATQSAFFDQDDDTQEFVCQWFNYDRADMYREMWREIWADDGDVSYRDMRIGIYRALKPLC